MIVKRFVGTKLHGYLDFRISFEKHLTFITGQNGGGKTTLVNSVVALISPNVEVLAAIQFERMSVTLIESGLERTIFAEKKTKV